MYKIEHIKDSQSNHIKLTNSNTSSYAKIALNDGASLQELCINNTVIIEDLSPLQYSDMYASSILFPFANRIKDGFYTYNNQDYQLEINQEEENNAIHGLVYNKTFKISNKNTSKNEASIQLEYEELNRPKGFPFTYTIRLNYILNKDGLKLNVLLENTDSEAFPFTLGWHPYFISKNLYESSLEFDSNKKLILDDKLITTRVKDFKNEEPFKVKNKTLDDCFILNTNTVKFTTPSYDMEIHTSSSETFLQLFTPSRANTIAIEPMTGVSDSFNNKIGLQILEPKKTYSLDWEIKCHTK